jgi:hypothetical protein
MTGEEFAKICFAARPMLWALAIIAVLLVAAAVLPKILGNNEGDGNASDSL